MANGSSRQLRSVSVQSAVKVARFLWPFFVEEHGCIFLDQHSGSNPPPANDTATGWESFINHTHVLDEFRSHSDAIQKTTLPNAGDANGETSLLVEVEWTYNETHPDFVAACELGQTAARLWACKLKQDFPGYRFRIYYTEYDNPIVRFHRVRSHEANWLSDDAIRSTKYSDLRNALVYDTDDLSNPVCGQPVTVN